MSKQPARATSMTLPPRTHDYIGTVAAARGISRNAAFTAMADEHAARLDLSLHRVTAERDEDTGEHLRVWELSVLPAGPHSQMLILVTDENGEVSSSSQFDRCERRDGWTRTTTSLDEGREFYAACAFARGFVARHEAAALFNVTPVREDSR